MIDRANMTAGIIFAALGGAFALKAGLDLPFGTASRMGPGYFPVVLGCILVIVGVVIALQAAGPSITLPQKLPIRAIVMITAAPIIFGATIENWGLVPATALSAFAAALAPTRLKPAFVVGVTIGLTIFCVAVFHYGLGLTLPLFGS